MATYNRAILAGNLATDPELRYTQGGTPVCEFVLAINRPRSQSESADFIRITVFGDDAETVAEHKKKGHGIQVEGRLDYQSWTAQDGSARSAVKVIARKKGGIQFLPQRSGISVNKVFLIGNLTRDPELVKVGKDDVLKANFGIAVNGLSRADNGEEPEADFFNAIAWRGLAKVMGDYKEKGHPIHLTGRLQYSAWEKDGHKRSKVEVVAEDIQFLPTREARKAKAPVAAGAPASREEEPAVGDEDFDYDTIPF